MSRYEEVAEDGLITAVLQQLFQRAPRPHPVLQSMQIDEEERKKPVHELTLDEVSTLLRDEDWKCSTARFDTQR